MNSEPDYSRQVLEAIRQGSPEFQPVELIETKRNNAAKAMMAVVCGRLSSGGDIPGHVKHTRFEWRDGTVSVRNSRIIDHHWSSITVATLSELEQAATTRPVLHLLTYFSLDERRLHVWAVPESIAREPLNSLPTGKSTQKMVEVYPEVQRFHKVEHSPDLTPYYCSSQLTDQESDFLAEAIKLDLAAKEQQSTADDSSEDDETEPEVTGVPYTSSTIDFLMELPQHASDGKWHTDNKRRYEKVLRDPTRDFVEQLRDQFIQTLSPEVAAGKRHLSILKKNDYGQGGYHDHYWFAFYDPDAGSKIKSCQLFVRLLGSEQVWRYGFSMGNYCDEYIARLQDALKNSTEAVVSYVRSAPENTLFRVGVDEPHHDYSPSEFAKALAAPITGESHPLNSSSNVIQVIREFPLGELVDHAEGLVDEVGQFFKWVWPFFKASIDGEWPVKDPGPGADLIDVDEDAPETIDILSEFSSLPPKFLKQMEDALLTKQQIVLVGPPGTSKTYIADLFGRYFARERQGQAQGRTGTLYMHANWSYEDFFEGLKPTSRDGQLVFQPKKGFFLEWVESLRGCDSSARHVLVLDEINRCDTAAVLGELLQLLEYRGRQVPLLSGSKFIFPRNLYIVGTMNSADRSIGRLDLALRRRFLWLELLPRPDVLQKWLAREGNNPVGFSSNLLSQCNEILDGMGIPPDQHVGHALFMVQTPGSETADPKDRPLRPELLERIVRFSVLPYLKELFLMQFGQIDQTKLAHIEAILLSSVETPEVAENDGSH